MQSDGGVVLNTTAHPQSAAAQPEHRPQGPTSQCLSRHCPATGVAVLRDFLPPGRKERGRTLTVWGGAVSCC